MWIPVGGTVSTPVSSMHVAWVTGVALHSRCTLVALPGTCDPLWDSLAHFAVCVCQVLVAFSLPQ